MTFCSISSRHGSIPIRRASGASIGNPWGSLTNIKLAGE